MNAQLLALVDAVEAVQPYSHYNRNRYHWGRESSKGEKRHVRNNSQRDILVNWIQSTRYDLDLLSHTIKLTCCLQGIALDDFDFLP